MLESLCGAVKADVGAELINTHHTSALLLRQLLQQADKWFLQMSADISAIENRYVCRITNCKCTSLELDFLQSHWLTGI